MQVMLLLLIYIANFLISWFNAVRVGRTWADSKVVGGWPRFVTWCAAAMSACGFTWCYLVALVAVCRSFDILPEGLLAYVAELGYVVVLVSALGAGVAIWVDSLIAAYRLRQITTGAIAAYNTFAMVHNSYEAVHLLPGIFHNLHGSATDSHENPLLRIAFLFVLFVMSAGVLTTVAIVRYTARAQAKEFKKSSAGAALVIADKAEVQT